MFTLSDTENYKCSETDEMTKSSQWHQWQGLGAVWNTLYMTVEPTIIIVDIILGIVLSVVQCEQAIRTVERHPIFP